MDQAIKTMMLEFLKRHYPVSRIKDNKRFKRGILLDNGVTYFLSDKTTHFPLKTNLINTLKKIFAYDEKTCKTILFEFLHF